MKNKIRAYFSQFDDLLAEEIEAIVAHTELIDFKKSSTILREGQISTHCYFIVEGCIRQYQIVNGEEKTNAFFTENQAVISYSSYMEATPSDFYLSCLEDCQLIVGSREQEQILYQKYPRLQNLLNILMPQDFSKTQKHLASMLSHNPEERYLSLLKNEAALLQRVPLQYIASYIGITPESLSRIRKRIISKDKS